MRRVESWYLAYALLGLSAAGLIPILLPLVEARNGTAAQVGLVMAAFSLGGLTAPVWGGLADRFRLHRWLLVGGLAGTAAGAALLAPAASFPLRTALALLSGTGLAAASTVANLFVVEAHPGAEWDARIGWLETFYGGGQVVGLLLAGIFGPGSPADGLRLAGAASLVAVLPAALGTRGISASLVSPRRLAPSPGARRAGWPCLSPRHLSHRPSLDGLRAFLAPAHAPFGLFLLAWLVSFAGAAAFFSFYPVLMQRLYGLSPSRSSAGYAVAAALGLALYAPAGAWSARRGPLAVLRDALGLRIAAFLALGALAISAPAGRGWLALACTVLVVLAWSLLSVSSTAIVASLSPGNEGEGMGLFNAVTALSGVIGAALGGWAAGLWGDGAVPVVGLAGVAGGLLLMAARRSGLAAAPQGRVEVSR